jgi:hypothetical protein
MKNEFAASPGWLHEGENLREQIGPFLWLKPPGEQYPQAFGWHAPPAGWNIGRPDSVVDYDGRGRQGSCAGFRPMNLKCRFCTL